MAKWEADEEGYILLSPLTAYAIAEGDREAVLVQLQFAADEQDAKPEVVQLALSPEQARDLGRALVQTANGLSARSDKGPAQ